MKHIYLMIIAFCLAVIAFANIMIAGSFINSVEQSRLESHYALMHDGKKCAAKSTDEAKKCFDRAHAQDLKAVQSVRPNYGVRI